MEHTGKLGVGKKGGRGALHRSQRQNFDIFKLQFFGLQNLILGKLVLGQKCVKVVSHIYRSHQQEVLWEFDSGKILPPHKATRKMS